VLSNLEYGIASRKGVTVVVGEAGSGKTTLIRTVIARQPQRVLSVHINNPTLSRQEFVETIGREVRSVGSRDRLQGFDARRARSAAPGAQRQRRDHRAHRR
jgi:type II secretory pathway predicted ATPase ExeA